MRKTEIKKKKKSKLKFECRIRRNKKTIAIKKPTEPRHAEKAGPRLRIIYRETRFMISAILATVKQISGTIKLLQKNSSQL